MTMTCEDARRLLPTYADGELGTTEALEFERHLATCASCMRALDAHRAESAALRERAPYHRMPDALRAQLQASLGDANLSSIAAQRERASTPRRATAWISALAAACVVAVGLAFVLVQWRTSGDVSREVVASHVRSLMADHLDDVVSSDRHTVKPWFAGKLDFSPPVVDLAEQGYALAGGRLDYLDKRAVAALDYRRRQHIINVFVWPNENAPATTAAMSTQDGYNLAQWSADGMTWWAVSDLNRAELQAFAALLSERSKTL